MYRVLKDFTDLQDKGYFYHAGDIFPRNNLKISRKRLSELSSSNNRQKVPLIKKVTDDTIEKSKNSTLRDIKNDI